MSYAIVAGVFMTAMCGTLWSQEPEIPELRTPEQEYAKAATGAAGVSCLEPPPMVRWQDYNGPLAKLVGTVAGKLDRTSVHLPNYKPGDVLCSLGAKDKFVLFVQDTADPITLLNVAFNSGLDHAENSESRFGQGFEGYGKRLGANAASDATGRFF